MKTIHHVVEIAATPRQVYARLTSAGGLASWWTTKVTTDGEVGGTIDFVFEAGFNPSMRITELVEPAAVRWQCVGGAAEWVDNTFDFELLPTDSGTRLRFWQHYTRELSDDAYGTYSFNWAYYLESLRLVCQTGTGKPFQSQ